MSLTRAQLSTLAALVDDAATQRREITRLSAEHPTLTLEQAYLIQRESIQRRIKRGDALVGMKMGLTSLAKMKQMSVHSPIYGHLTRSMVAGDGDAIQASRFIHPRVEPEVAFILGAPLRGPVTPAQAMLAVRGVTAALEIIDSRYEKFKFTLPDVVADNASSTCYVLGSTILSPEALDLSNIGMVMEINGQPKQIGSSAAIYEHPARSLAALANMLAEVGEQLHEGQVILAGGATAAEAISAGDRVTLRTDGLGEVRFSLV